MNTDALTAIDATLEQRCACGCGTELDPAGPSAWFAHERCQSRWRRQAAAGAPPTDRRDPRDLEDAVRHLAGAFVAAIQSLAAALAPVMRQIDAAGIVPAAPPEDPMRRALWLRRNRNTGPTQGGRAPRRIDPRRGQRR